MTFIDGRVYVVRVVSSERLTPVPFEQVAEQIKELLAPIQVKKSLEQAKSVLATAKVEYQK